MVEWVTFPKVEAQVLIMPLQCGYLASVCWMKSLEYSIIQALSFWAFQVMRALVFTHKTWDKLVGLKEGGWTPGTRNMGL